jgi:hypothetical protein
MFENKLCILLISDLRRGYCHPLEDIFIYTEDVEILLSLSLLFEAFIWIKRKKLRTPNFSGVLRHPSRKLF